ncbi:MoxR-like ATPase [Paenibacillus sp. UNCCL117]|uniref:AAA family ATPase n=1 Tax=unclassified Paenibacillus TaxID=185978 RepID=UPI00088BBA89|nr:MULTISPECIES: MoxR family ATPase [unclassified Paenibacillus]SDD13565.1 MoxR-like ATPase [Paenibacillus sp. cl123]SFW34013.1 MoxR-like ATPase [Paenibacillus sp. UNCCL117]
MRMEEIGPWIGRIRANLAEVIVGKEMAVDLLLTAVLADGHALLEDVPGTGKTLLAKSLARSLDCTFKRIQFTPDLLPSDLSGINFYNQRTGNFEFRAGPVFTGILLADEINRATPRTQSSLLECMEERQITIDGVTHRLERPFLVIATQNPVDNQGTFPLPEAQLDRFLLKIEMGYPTFEEGVGILQRFRLEQPLERLEPAASAEEVVAAQRLAAEVRIDEELCRYIVRLAESSRTHPDVALGVSPRGTQALLKASQAYALVQGRDYVTPDDIKAMAVPVLSHRLLLQGGIRVRGGGRSAEVIRRLLASVEVPTEPELPVPTKAGAGPFRATDETRQAGGR